MRKKYLFKSLLLLCALIAGASSSWAAEVTFTQTSTTEGTLAGAPAGVTATFSTTYSNMNQLTSGNSMTLTLTGWAKNIKITGITLEVCNNTNRGNGTATATIGATTLGTMTITGLGNTYQEKEMTITPTFATSDLEISIAATANSVYCKKFTIEYELPKTLTGITLADYKTNFYVDDEFEYGGTVTANYSDADDEDVTSKATFTGYNMSAAGSQTVTVSYSGQSKTYDITVSERPKFTVTFNDDSSTLTEASVGGGIVLPSRTGANGYTFVGWSESAVSMGALNATYQAAGSTYYPTDNTTLYPVYSYKAMANAEEWTEITAIPTEGTYAICSEKHFMKASIASNRFDNGEEPSIADGKLSVAPASDCVWKITKPDSYYRIQNGSNYAGGTNNKNQGALLTEASADLAKWTITYSNGFIIENYGRSKGSDNNNRYLRNNDNYGWATYASGTGEAPRLFRKGIVIKETTLYTSTPITTATITLNAACTDGDKYYGTYSNARAFIVPADLVISEVSIVEGQLYVENYETGATVPANTGVMVAAATAGEHAVTFSAETGESVLDSDNFLRATGDEDITAELMDNADANCMFYRLTMHNGNSIGYWWGAAEGAAFALAANKAYLAVPASTGARQGLWFDEESTGIQSIDNGLLTMDNVYDLSGRKIVNGKSVNSKLQRGLYIVNGKKVVIK